MQLLNKIPSLFLFFTFLFAINCPAQNVITISRATDKYGVEDVAWLKDTSSTLNISQVSSPEYASKFSLSKHNLDGENAEFSYWLKLRIQFDPLTTDSRLLEFNNWQYVDFYIANGDGRFTKKITGHFLPFKQRDFQASNYNLIELLPVSGKPIICYVHLQFKAGDIVQPINLSFSIYSKQDFQKRESVRLNLICFFSGIYLIMLLYNLFIYISTRENGYRYYLGLLTLLLFAGVDNSGYTVQLFRDIASYPIWFGKLDVISSSMFGSLMLLFAMDFLKLNEGLLGKLYKGMLTALVIVIIPAIFGSVMLATNISSVLGLLTIALIIVSAVIRCYQRYPSSNIFLFAYGAFVVGVAIFLLRELGVLPNTFFTEFAMQTGSSIEAVLFSLALANRINVLKQQNELSQAEIIRQLDENSKLQLKVNAELEDKVEQRTRELRESQKQLLQKEKLAALGELTAGIAHEIQNPLNFVNNFSEVSAELAEELKDELKNGNTDGAITLADDIYQNLQKINHHGKRADSIVKNMLQHSRSGGGEKIATDINYLTAEFLKLSYNSLRKKDSSLNVELEQFFDNNLPKIEIVSADIGRVLLNIFNNAFYAMADKLKQQIENYTPKLTVSTLRLPSALQVRVEDNGTGIPDAVVDKIFQPFFTTKPTGEGTGLGLSLSYDIVKAHGGEITVSARPGCNTILIITLPLNTLKNEPV